jgi:hypothetical protein
MRFAMDPLLLPDGLFNHVLSPKLEPEIHLRVQRKGNKVIFIKAEIVNTSTAPEPRTSQRLPNLAKTTAVLIFSR